ncbi:Fis family transcriptional regulator [Egicoccus halophilus]|uniref:Fis family transcriptional regulator n=1 Tax=Egicoccus halophilus TaxID=1670830 RepID=A0A8J3AA25_9ACTN|nr:Fis family transcriptional regulator [Egicoccus halophilus]
MVVEDLRAQLPEIAARTVEAITAEVPEYTGSLDAEMRATIARAVEDALATFLRLVARPEPVGGTSPLEAATEGAYRLGRGEARSGRTMDALLAAYRVGARSAWQQMSDTAVASGVPASDVAHFAALVFAYIDALSASSLAGHADELASTGRRREQYREQLARTLVSGASIETLRELAERAAWPPPETLTALLVPAARVHEVLGRLAPDTLNLPGDAIELRTDVPLHVLLVPDAARRRTQLLDVLASTSAVVGPARPWTRAADSLRLAVRARALLGPPAGAPLDSVDHLAALAVGADLDALADLRRRVLAPFADLPADTAERLVDTLRAWVLHQGRRSAVAADLHVHPQTVRYRMTQVRERLGDQLEDPTFVQDLVVALTVAPPTA